MLTTGVAVMKHNNLKHLTIYALVIIGYWSIISLLSISPLYGTIAFFPFTLISSRIISIRWPINTYSRIAKKVASNEVLSEVGRYVSVYRSSYSHVERITTLKILQLVIEKYVDKFLAATAERIQAFQTYTLVFGYLFILVLIVRIVIQQTTSRADIVVIVIIAAAEPVWQFLRYRPNRSAERAGT